jgi:hypothetical protein
VPVAPEDFGLLPLLYLHDLSTGDFVPALEQFRVIPRQPARGRPGMARGPRDPSMIFFWATLAERP